MKSVDYKKAALQFHTACKATGWNYVVNDTLVSVVKSFSTTGNDGFIECDMQYGDLLSMVPTTSAGSTWGTDGGGVGALSAMKSGVFMMHKSGVSKRFTAALLAIQHGAYR